MLTSQAKHLVWSSSGTLCVLNTPQKMVEIVLLQFWNTPDSTTCRFITPMRDFRFIWSSWPFRMKEIHPFETSVCTHLATRFHIPETPNHLDPCFTGLLYLLCHFICDISSKIFFLWTFEFSSTPLSDLWAVGRLWVCSSSNWVIDAADPGAWAGRGKGLL